MMTTRKMVGVTDPIHTKLKSYALRNGLSMSAAIDKAVLSAEILETYKNGTLHGVPAVQMGE